MADNINTSEINDELDDLFEFDDVDLVEDGEIIEGEAEEVNDDDADSVEVGDDEVIQALEQEDAKIEAYEEQDENATPAPSMAAPKKEPKKSKRVPRGEITGDSVVSSASTDLLRLAGDDDRDEEERKSEIASIIDGIAAIKVKEKAANLFESLTKGRKVSGYTDKAVRALIGGECDGKKSLVDHYVASGYAKGTARSQARQMEQLLPALKMADLSGEKLTVNENSPLVQAIMNAA